MITLSGRQERNFLAIATEDGIYVGLRDNLDHSVRVLQLPNVTQMTALASQDCLVLIFEKTLHSYSLEPFASVALGQVPSKPAEQTMEILAPQHKGQIAFFRVGSLGDQDCRTSIHLFIYALEETRHWRSETFSVVYGIHASPLTTICTLRIIHGVFQQGKGRVRILC